jgi:pilus assembly protein CpaB
MRAVFGLVLILGVGLAGFAVYMAKGYIADNKVRLARAEAARAAMVPTVEIIAAKRPLVYGQELTKDDLQVIRYSERHLPEGVFLTMDDVFSKGDDEMRVVLRPIEVNEAILAVKVSAPGEDAGLTQRLGQGMRAFAIRVDVSSGVSGFLRPGDRVDVYWSGSSGNANRGEEFTRLIQSSVALIAVDQTSDGSRNEAQIARTVTVEVTPTQVAALAQAQATGKLSLALVGTGDNSVAESIEIDNRALLGIQEEQIVEVEREQECSIKTRRGADVVEIPIPCTN